MPSRSNCAQIFATIFLLKQLARSYASDSLPEWSKGVDSSSTSASCVGSNPTAVIFQILHASLGKAPQYNETTGISEII